MEQQQGMSQMENECSWGEGLMGGTGRADGGCFEAGVGPSVPLISILPPLSQRRAVRGMPTLQHHRPAPLLPGDPDGPALPGAERRERGRDGGLDAVLLPGCLQRGEPGTTQVWVRRPLPSPGAPLGHSPADMELPTGAGMSGRDGAGSFLPSQEGFPAGHPMEMGFPSCQILTPLFPAPCR